MGLSSSLSALWNGAGNSCFLLVSYVDSWSGLHSGSLKSWETRFFSLLGSEPGGCVRSAFL